MKSLIMFGLLLCSLSVYADRDDGGGWGHHEGGYGEGWEHHGGYGYGGGYRGGYGGGYRVPQPYYGYPQTPVYVPPPGYYPQPMYQPYYSPSIGITLPGASFFFR